MRFSLPYDKKGVTAEIDDRNLAWVLISAVESCHHHAPEVQLVEAVG